MNTQEKTLGSSIKAYVKLHNIDIDSEHPSFLEAACKSATEKEEKLNPKTK